MSSIFSTAAPVVGRNCVAAGVILKQKTNKGLHGCITVCVASYKKYVLPENKDHVIFPERRRLRIIEKLPPIEHGVKVAKMMKDLHQMRGPEEVHNKLQYGDYGIQAVTGGRLDHKTCEAVRMIIVRQMDEKKSFAVWRHQKLWQSVTKKGQGQRMGGGKGAIDHYVFPFKAERIILEMGGYLEFEEAEKILRVICKNLPFLTRIVTHQSMKEREEREALEEKTNMNPFTFKYCAQNNVLGCHNILNRYDHMWYGKYK